MRELREKVGVSQTELAALLEKGFGLKLDGSAITRIENNAYPDRSARIIRLGEAVTIAKALESDLHEMLRPDIPLEVQLRRAQERAVANENRVRELTVKAADARREVALLEAKLKEEEERAKIRSVYDQMLTHFLAMESNLAHCQRELEQELNSAFDRGEEADPQVISRMQRQVDAAKTAVAATDRQLRDLESRLGII
jgi:chromosome segregation ATPase